eukprot:g43178.t1
MSDYKLLGDSVPGANRLRTGVAAAAHAWLWDCPIPISVDEVREAVCERVVLGLGVSTLDLRYDLISSTYNASTIPFFFCYFVLLTIDCIGWMVFKCGRNRAPTVFTFVQLYEFYNLKSVRVRTLIDRPIKPRSDERDHDVLKILYNGGRDVIDISRLYLSISSITSVIISPVVWVRSSNCAVGLCCCLIVLLILGWIHGLSGLSFGLVGLLVTTLGCLLLASSHSDAAGPDSRAPSSSQQPFQPTQGLQEVLAQPGAPSVLQLASGEGGVTCFFLYLPATQWPAGQQTTEDAVLYGAALYDCDGS